MILAGGALAATACGGLTAAQADGASATSDAGRDAKDKASGDDGRSSDDVEDIVNCCVNAATDPCSDPCFGSGGPDAATCVSCRQAETACEAMNGFYQTQVDGTLGCAFFGNNQPPDAGPTDAAADVQFQFPCCNANPDPCCPIAYCSGGVGPDASIYLTCEQNRTQCESMNGDYGPQPDGILGCTHADAHD